MSYFVSKIGHLDPRYYILIYYDTRGPDVVGPDVLICFQNWTSRHPLHTVLYTVRYRGSRCQGPDVGGSDVGGPDVRVRMSDFHR